MNFLLFQLLMVATELLEERTFRLNVKLGAMLNDCLFDIANLIDTELKNLTGDDYVFERQCGFVQLKFPINLNSDSTLRLKRSPSTVEDPGSDSKDSTTCEGPVIESITSDTYAVLGDTVLLTCSIRQGCTGYQVRREGARVNDF